ncbi:MAG: fibronectin type III domain-containing protein [Candidatus Pacebacteria bacterium]|nr:fibronectin type III domain-containing protein [Candidatus Paceibacterota bacterium]
MKHVRLPAFVLAFVALALFGFAQVYATEISNVRIVEVTEDSATVKWSTDVNTDATINYGLNPDVGVVRYPLFDKKEHTLTIDDLDPSTTYYFRVVSTDEKGNKSATAGFVFSTEGDDPTDATERIQDPEQQAVAERIIDDLDKVTDPQAIVAIADKVKQVAQDILKPPAIIGKPRVTITGDEVDITWTTDRESNTVVHLAPEGEYDPNAADPYTITQGDPEERTKTHRVTVIGLEPSTVYHFKVSSTDSVGLKGESEDDTFRTKSKVPLVENVSITRIQETSATFNWTTGGVLAKGLVEYRNLRTNVVKSAGIPIFATRHSVPLTGLEFGTRYTAVVSSINEAGDITSSKPISFATVRDLVAPEISKVSNESTLFPGEEVKIQTILSWETDEPSLCQVFYVQGLVIADEADADSLLPETNPLTSHTQVIVGFAPATVYKFWTRCKDEAGNESRSEDFVLITPIKEKSIVDVILENFEGTFGWVKNI